MADQFPLPLATGEQGTDGTVGLVLTSRIGAR